MNIPEAIVKVAALVAGATVIIACLVTHQPPDFTGDMTLSVILGLFLLWVLT